MVDFVYGVSSFERRRGNFPELPVVNMFAEVIPTEPNTVLQSRPGLEDSTITMGAGPVKGLFAADGVLSGTLFGVSSSALYSSSTKIGNIDGTGPVSFDGYSDYLFVTSGASAWTYDGTTLSAIAFPDGADVTKVVVAASRAVFLRANSGTIYWTDPLGITVDSLAFATAENSPDTLKDMLYVGDKLILFGAETIEYWQVTDDNDLPFSPLIGATLPVGIKGTGMAVEFNRTFAWVTNFNEVCVGQPDNIVSDPDLQVKIANSSNVSLWVFYVDDNEYLAVRIDNETWAYGARSGVWSELQSDGETNWIPQCWDSGYFGSSVDGRLVQWSDDYTDFDGALERRFRAWSSLTGDVLWLNNVILRTNPGTTPYVVGDFTDPVVELRTSRDGGNEWQPWKSRTLGSQGNYRRKTFWNSLGQFSYPGVLVEVRVSDPVPFRVSGLALNEPFGGR